MSGIVAWHQILFHAAQSKQRSKYFSKEPQKTKGKEKEHRGSNFSHFMDATAQEMTLAEFCKILQVCVMAVTWHFRTGTIPSGFDFAYFVRLKSKIET